MKIKIKKTSWEKLAELPKIPYHKPLRPMFLLRLLIRVLSIPALMQTRFSYEDLRGDRKEEGPYLILMNHSSFLDLKIASKILFPHPYSIVSTTDAFVGKSLLMRLIGCVATQKFVTDAGLVLTMLRLAKKEKRSILMYPEAGYSFDGRATRLPKKLGGLCKKMGVPVLLIRTDASAFLRDPLYNGLRTRKVKAGATLSCLFTRAELKEKSVDELDAMLEKAFDFDHFAAQRTEGIKITESFRAEGLERILYRCPHCEKDGVMKGHGVHLTCTSCGAEYLLEEDGSLSRQNGEAAFNHIPRWVDYQRDSVKKELANGAYGFTLPVSVYTICDHKALYLVGKGTLTHDRSGFTLTSEDKRFTYRQDPYSSYSLNVDFFFYEIGDMISIGTKDRLFYCFPETPYPVHKARLAAEEMYLLPKA
ncbi:MAG: hypothetical protein E7580_07635 [Ruminococcaceae bacterium]|nr:hypothetical protein [Oscillospiraceae bacterium]